MKKDLKLLALKDVTLKSSSENKIKTILFASMACFIIFALAFVAINGKIKNSKTEEEISKLKSDTSTNNVSFNNNFKSRNLEDLKNKSANLEKTRIEYANNYNNLRYGILEDILQNPNGSNENLIKKEIGNLFKSRNGDSEKDPNKDTYLVLDHVSYDIDGTGYKAALSFKVAVPKLKIEPNSKVYDFKNPDFVVNKYKEYLEKMLDPKQNEIFKSISKSNMTVSQSSEFDNNENYSFLSLQVQINIPRSVYKNVIDELEKLYNN